MKCLRYFIKCACTFHTEPTKEKEARTAPVKGELGEESKTEFNKVRSRKSLVMITRGPHRTCPY